MTKDSSAMTFGSIPVPFFHCLQRTKFRVLTAQSRSSHLLGWPLNWSNLRAFSTQNTDRVPALKVEPGPAYLTQIPATICTWMYYRFTLSTKRKATHIGVVPKSRRRITSISSLDGRNQWNDGWAWTKGTQPSKLKCRHLESCVT